MAEEKKQEKAQAEEKKQEKAQAPEKKVTERPEGVPPNDSGSGKDAKPKAEQPKKEAQPQVKSEKKEKGKSDIELTAKMKDIISSIEGMTVLELSDLVKALEDKFGVTAAQPVVAAAGMAGAAPGAAAAEEKSIFTVVLTGAGSNKIQVIKEIRAITTLGLKEAKDLVEAAPKTVKEGVAKEEAEDIKKKLEAAGGKVELK